MNEASTMTHKNEVHISGVIAKDPVTRTTTTGKIVATVTISTTFKAKTEYHRVVCWEELATKIQALLKGEFVKVVGRLQTRSWEDDSKVKHYATEVIAFQVVVPSKEPVAITPSYPAKSESRTMTGTAIARAVLAPPSSPAPTTTNIHGVRITDHDIPF
jgi:single-strand DNA-binding protein